MCHCQYAKTFKVQFHYDWPFLFLTEKRGRKQRFLLLLNSRKKSSGPSLGYVTVPKVIEYILHDAQAIALGLNVCETFMTKVMSSASWSMYFKTFGTLTHPNVLCLWSKT